MNRNIKDAIVIAIIIVVAPFMLAGCATTSPSTPQGIRGQYSGTGQGMALMAPFGFKPNSTPSCTDTPQGPVCPSLIQTWTGEGVFLFNQDGTGSLTSLVSFVTESFRGPSGIVPNSTGIQKVSNKFHYTITDGGKITITADTYTLEWISGPNAKKIYHLKGWVRKGIIAPGGKMIILTSSVADVVSFVEPYGDMIPTTQLVSNGTHVLIWQHD
jgi:hypothetical protein